METRILPYPLSNAENREYTDNATDDINTFTWPTLDNDERVYFSIGLSLNEYIQLASSLDVGRDIAYPEQSFYVWYLWQRIIMSLCEQIAECIETNIETQAAIANAISNNSAIQQAIADYIKQSGLNTPSGAIDPSTDTVNSIGAIDNSERIGTIDDCDNDKLWGALRYGVVAYLADNALNFLEDLNTIADKGQRASNLVSGIPIVGDVLASTVSAFAEAIPDLLNLFNAHDSETVRDEIACELFQIGCADCLLPTYGELIGYYSALGVTGFDDLENVAFQLATDLLIGSSTLTGSVVYHTVIAYELAVLYVGSKFNQAIGANIVNVWAEIGIDFANDNWILLCDGCEPDDWTVEYDFTTGSHGWTLGVRGGYTTGVGFTSTVASGLNSVFINKAIPETCEINKITLEYNWGVTPYSTVVFTALRDNVNSATGQVTFINTTTTDGDNNCYAEDKGVNYYNRNFISAYLQRSGSQPPTLEITKIKVGGKGAKPTDYTSENVDMECPA